IVNKQCRPNETETYNCHGHWTEKDVHYLIVKERHTGKKHCYVFSKLGDVLSISGFERHACHRGLLKGTTPRVRHNASESGERCDPSSAALSTASSRHLSFVVVGLTVLSVMALLSLL
uniref:Uncharacterized protein n=1 Tax=Plectus sambesii TaxID=2011161 RepID=A0A914WXU3_9BILA